ncbi:glycoside hydrolase family 16 protein, partial [Periconia macrospinosa]
MPSSSSFFIKAATVLSTLSTTSATVYKLQDTYKGDSFLDGFTFFNKPDPTNGFVNYVSKSAAQQQHLVKQKDGDQYIGVDYESHLTAPAGPGRNSVRIETVKKYNHGLFIVDLKHMPGSICGTWPAFWTYNTEVTWPIRGEVDIIEGVNENTANKMVLHTDTKCSVDGLGQSGAQSLYNCALDSPSGPSGCDVNAQQPNSYGTGFNNNQGGVYAMEWTSSAIKMWFFPRNSIPTSITKDAPDVAEFGIPTANFQGACNLDERVINQQFVFDTTFCGDWGGNVYSQSSCPQYPGLNSMDSCKKYVAENPSAFKEAYWQISYFKSY